MAARPEKASPLQLQCERLPRGLTASFCPCPACLWRLLTLTLAAAKGEQDGNDGPAPICPLIYGVLHLVKVDTQSNRAKFIASQWPHQYKYPAAAIVLHKPL